LLGSGGVACVDAAHELVEGVGEGGLVLLAVVVVVVYLRDFGEAEDVVEVPAPRSVRPRRRGLGPGWKRVRATG
jgi:hypothetical protein